MVHRIASASVNDPRDAASPAIGSTTSLGIGGKRLSIPTAIAAPAGPIVSISETVQSASVVSHDPPSSAEASDACA